MSICKRKRDARRESKASRKRRRRNALKRAKKLPALAELLGGPGSLLERTDVALLNLVCAVGLPGDEDLDVSGLLETLDDWARQVRIATHDNYDRFLESPGGFRNSQAYFCVIYLITVLQERFGVRYHPKWRGMKPDAPMPWKFGTDSKDLFIHGITDGDGGTCGSLPVLYAAVGRRLGYPLKLVKADQHLFLRWDDPEGKHWFHAERFNVEVTTPGVHCLPDEHYKTWPHELPAEDIEAGIFLKSLTPREELAEFLVQRAACQRRNGRDAEAIVTYRRAAGLVPGNYHFRKWYEEGAAWLKTVRRGHLFMNAPVEDPFYRGPRGPRWVELTPGERMLVQVLEPGGQPIAEDAMRDLGCQTVYHTVQLPNGPFATATLPRYDPRGPMKATWVPLQSGQYALVHKPEHRLPGAPATSNRASRLSWPGGRRIRRQPQRGEPILPDDAPTPWLPAGSSDELRPHERQAVENAVGQLNQPQHIPQLPRPDRLSLPPGPGPPRLGPDVGRVTV